MRPTRRPAATLAALLALLGAGCLGSYNPGYFPFYFPGGRVLQSHAKPGGLGYFRDFDPKAQRLEVTPSGTASAPLNAPIVLVAAVLDKDGQPRRSRRVEWVLEGPGSIIEVDESGFYAGRGYKVDNKYAVSHTGYTGHTITRGNDDPKDDVELTAGQTFCVVTSAVPGETTVTAYAPGVFNWENGRVVTKIVWGEGRFSFPQAAVVRFGSEHTLTTTVNRLDQDGPGPLPAYRIRYKLLDTLDSPPAALVSRGGAGTTAAQTGEAREFEVPVDDGGRAAVRLVARDAKPGKTRVRVEVVRPPESGVGAGAVVAARETLVEWAEPALKLNVTAPPAAAPGRAFPVVVSLANGSPVDSREANVWVAVPPGVALQDAEPPPVGQDDKGFRFALPPVANGKRQEVSLRLAAAKAGPVTLAATAETADRLSATSSAVTRVEPARLQVLAEVPAGALAGEPIPARVAVTNTAAVPADRVVVYAQLDRGLSHPSNQNPVELTLGTLAAGETKTLDLPLTAATAGRFTLSANVQADGGVGAQADPVAVAVRRAEVAVAVTGPQLVYVGQEFTWTVGVTNPGDAPVSDVIVRATLPPEAKVVDAGGGTATPGAVEWRIPEVKPGDQKGLKLVCSAAALIDRATVNVTAIGTAAGGKERVERRAAAALVVIGVPAVALELATPAGTLEVGKAAAFQIRLRNRGSVSARNLQVTALAPPELRAVRGTGNGDARIDADGKVTFPPVEELRPGQTVVLTVQVQGARPGDARFRAEVRAEHLRTPLAEEQSLRVTGR